MSSIHLKKKKKKDSLSSRIILIFSYSVSGFPSCKLKYHQYQHLLYTLILKHKNCFHFNTHIPGSWYCTKPIDIITGDTELSDKWHVSFHLYCWIPGKEWQLHRAFNLVSHYLNEWSNFHRKMSLKLNIENPDNVFTDLKWD